MKKSKNIFLLISALFILNPLNAETLKFNTQDFAPFIYKINGKLSGPGVEMLELICSKAQIKCKSEMLPWSRAQKGVQKGKAQGLYLIGWNKKRAEYLHFSPPVLTTEYVFFVRKGSSFKYTKISDLKNKKIAVYGPSNLTNTLEKLHGKLTSGKFKIEVRPDDESGFKKLSKGRVDGVFSNINVGNALISKLNIKNVVYGGTQRQLNYFYGLSKKYTKQATVDRFNVAVKKLNKNGGLAKILNNHNMTPISN